MFILFLYIIFYFITSQTQLYLTDLDFRLQSHSGQKRGMNAAPKTVKRMFLFQWQVQARMKTGIVTGVLSQSRKCPEDQPTLDLSQCSEAFYERPEDLINLMTLRFHPRKAQEITHPVQTMERTPGAWPFSCSPLRSQALHELLAHSCISLFWSVKCVYWWLLCKAALKTKCDNICKASGTLPGI